MTKQTIIDLAKTFGCETHYQGSTNTMFVKGNNFIPFSVTVDVLYPDVYNHFKIEETKVWPLPVAKFTTEKEIAALLQEEGQTGVNRINENIKEFSENVQTFVNDNVSFEGTNKQSLVTDEMGQMNFDTVVELDRQNLNASLTDGRFEATNDDIKKANGEKANLDAKRKLIDEYLIANPIDRTQKGCYNHVAEIFEVSVDYVRDRYRKLRVKGLVEKEIVNS